MILNDKNNFYKVIDIIEDVNCVLQFEESITLNRLKIEKCSGAVTPAHKI